MAPAFVVEETFQVFETWKVFKVSVGVIKTFQVFKTWKVSLNSFCEKAILKKQSAREKKDS